MRTAALIPLIFIFIQSSPGQELAFESTQLDPNTYELSGGPVPVLQQLMQYEANNTFMQLRPYARFNKKTSQYDIFINETKTASVNNLDTTRYNYLYPQLISQTIFNGNDDWETLWQYTDSIQPEYSRSLLTASDGTTIWKTLPTERGGLLFFDGTYTYIYVTQHSGDFSTQRYYRFHPAYPLANSSLSKKASPSSGVPRPLFLFNAAGDCTIKLNRSPGGATTVSLLNLLGQQIFTRTIPDLDKEVSITLPSGAITPGTVIAKVQNGSGTSFTKTAPVK